VTSVIFAILAIGLIGVCSSLCASRGSGLQEWGGASSRSNVIKHFPGVAGSMSREVAFSIAQGEFVRWSGIPAAAKSTLTEHHRGPRARLAGGVVLEGREITQPGTTHGRLPELLADSRG